MAKIQSRKMKPNLWLVRDRWGARPHNQPLYWMILMKIKLPISKKKEILLVREASMASMSIGIGLTHIRKYDFVQPGFFYSSLYSITTGIERLMKLILIYRYRVENSDKFPDNGQLKAFGHKISDLFNLSLSINSDFGFKNEEDIYKKDTLSGIILNFLSDFANQARYYNLDTLTGRQQNNKEPMKRWDEEVNSVILKRHYKPKKEKLEQIKAIAAMAENSTFVKFSDDGGNDVGSLRDFYLKGDQVTTKQKYSMYYIYVIVRFLSNLLADLQREGRLYPVLQEFFVVFRNSDKSYVLNKKSWNPNSPYKF